MLNNRNASGEDSLKKRYFFKFLANCVGILFNLVIQAIVPRRLGPGAYGDFSFLTSFFNQIVGFLDTGTSTCFYVKLSQRPKDFQLVSFYFRFIGIASLLVLGFVATAFLTTTYISIWPKQSILYIYLAAWLGILTWIVQVFSSMTDAYGLTVNSEVMKIAQRVFGFFLIVLLCVFHQINLANLFYYNYLVLSFLGVFLVWILERNGYSLKRGMRLTIKQIRAYLGEFYQYSQPLFICSLVVLIASIFDRWLLQVYGGSIEQGFYGLSFQIGVISFLFAGAMTPLFMRELAIAHEKKDLARMSSLFQRYVPILFSVAAFFSCFMAIQAERIVYIFGGSRFNGAIVAVAIMAFYPIYQTYGQLSNSVFYAMGQTRLYSNLGIIFMLIGLPVTYFLIAPLNKFGINAGATGLAIKMVVINIIGVNVQIYFNSRQLNLNFWQYFRYQIFSIGCLLILALGASFGVDHLLRSHDKALLHFFVSGALYSFMAVGVVYFFPSIFGIRKEDINSFIRMVTRLEFSEAMPKSAE